MPVLDTKIISRGGSYPSNTLAVQAAGANVQPLVC